MKGNLALLAGTFVLCALLAEIVLRVIGFGQPLIHNYDPDLLWDLPPNSTAYAPSYGVGYRTNSLGWRDDEIPSERAPGETRILALGDSVLFGQGVPFAQTFSERLEALLADATGSDRVEVINTGVSGYGIHQYRVILERALAAYQPDLVLILFVKNDVLSARDVEELRENARTGRQGNVDTPRIRARRASALFHAADGLVARLFPEERAPRALRYDRAEIAPEAWEHTVAELERMLRVLEERRTPLVVATVPLAREVRNRRIELELEPLERLSASRGFHLLSLFSSFATRADEVGDVLFLDGVHPSPVGHEIAAEAVGAYLVEHGLAAGE